jgi:hypothetical protein
MIITSLIHFGYVHGIIICSTVAILNRQATISSVRPLVSMVTVLLISLSFTGKSFTIK